MTANTMGQPMTVGLWLLLMGIAVAGVLACMVVDKFRAARDEVEEQIRLAKAVPWRPDTNAAHNQAMAIANDSTTVASELAARCQLQRQARSQR